MLREESGLQDSDRLPFVLRLRGFRASYIRKSAPKMCLVRDRLLVDHALARPSLDLYQREAAKGPPNHVPIPGTFTTATAVGRVK